MKTIFKLVLLFFMMLMSCKEDENTIEPSEFCASNPLQEIDWIKDLVEVETSVDVSNSTGLEIIQYEYRGDLAFSVDSCVNNCSDSLLVVYDCDQKSICEVGGIAGVNTCEVFFKEAKNETLLFTSRNTSGVFNCEKQAVISEALFNSSKASPIKSAKIINNCLSLTFTILSAQDKIADVTLVDSGLVLESFPIQRRLKLIIKENLTRPTSVEVETSFDLSNLVAWDNANEIILNIEGLEESLVYKRVPQCGDPNFNCVADSQVKEREMLDALFLEINATANAISCEDATRWEYTPIGNKACGGPARFIAYSVDMDVDAFLEKVENYTNLEVMFNKKWKVVSDCAVVKSPIGIKCKEGKPVLE